MRETANIGPDIKRDAADSVALTRLTLSDFRNYEHLTIRLERSPMVLTGDNGAGKTNLLEAVSMLAPGRGLRRANLAECARHNGAGGWAVAAEIETGTGPVRLGTGLSGDAADRQRKCRIDGESVSGPGAFEAHLHVLWLTPAMDRLFTGPAGDRRRFVDRMVSSLDAQHRRSAGRFERAMSERNRLLALGRRDETWLDSLEAQMAEAGTALAASRIAGLSRLQDTIDATSGVSIFPPARLAIAGSLEDWLATMPAVEAEDAFRDQLKASRGRDQAAGRALDGPHRSDLVTHHGQTGANAADCSTGEQKALLISTVLARSRLSAQQHGGRRPVILLDEVTAHLDATRRAALFDEIAELGAQAWMTGTDPAQFDALSGRAQFYIVSGTQAGAEVRPA